MSDPTPLPEPDRPQIDAFWGRVLAAGLAEQGTPVPDADFFGDSVELADQLVDLIVAGRKRATASSHEEYLHDGSAMPQPGRLSLALDGHGQARALIRTTEVRVGPLASVDDRFAWDEGEGDRTRASWLEAHHRFFSRWLPQVGLRFDPDMPTVFERFEVLYVE